MSMRTALMVLAILGAWVSPTVVAGGIDWKRGVHGSAVMSCTGASIIPQRWAASPPELPLVASRVRLEGCSETAAGAGTWLELQRVFAANGSCALPPAVISPYWPTWMWMSFLVFDPAHPVCAGRLDPFTDQFESHVRCPVRGPMQLRYRGDLRRFELIAPCVADPVFVASD